MLADIMRFNRLARSLLDRGAVEGTIDEFLTQNRFGHAFRSHYLLPMAAAIWSTGTGDAQTFPATTLLRFLDNHGLLQVSGHLTWRSVVGGSSAYLPKLVEPFANRIHGGVAHVVRDPDVVRLRLDDGSVFEADAVVLATHADDTLGLLADASPDEKELFGQWTYSRNETILHRDVRQLPTRPRAWASWNYVLDDCSSPTSDVSLSYHMNRLQALDTDEQHVVTLNPRTPIAPELIDRRLVYTHPVYSEDSVASQPALREISGKNRTFLAGAYLRYGFHEDGLWSAQQVAEQLGVTW